MFEGLLPYQFIKSTFLELTRRHFPAEIVGLTEEEILRLRTDPDLSRRCSRLLSGKLELS